VILDLLEGDFFFGLISIYIGRRDALFVIIADNFLADHTT